MSTMMHMMRSVGVVGHMHDSWRAPSVNQSHHHPPSLGPWAFPMSAFWHAACNGYWWMPLPSRTSFLLMPNMESNVANVGSVSQWDAVKCGWILLDVRIIRRNQLALKQKHISMTISGAAVRRWAQQLSAVTKILVSNLEKVLNDLARNSGVKP